MSKFDKIFEAREAEETLRKENGKPVNKPKSNGVVAKSENKVKKVVLAPTATGRRGRPKAKRSDPDYVGFTTYIRKDTHLNVKIALLQEGEGRELSELVENLLTKWMKSM